VGSAGAWRLDLSDLANDSLDCSLGTLFHCSLCTNMRYLRAL
jgi:hypothetical protein